MSLRDELVARVHEKTNCVQYMGCLNVAAHSKGEGAQSLPCTGCTRFAAKEEPPKELWISRKGHDPWSTW